MKSKIRIPIARYLFALIITSLYAIFVLRLADEIFKGSRSGILYVLIFFSIVIVFVLILFTNKVIFFGEMTKEDIKRDFEIKKNDIGLFEYSGTGFFYKKVSYIEWADIKKVILIKEDNFDVDRISILIETDNNHFELSEDEPGRYIFLEKLTIALKSKDFNSSFLTAYAKGNYLLWEKED